MRSVLRAYYEGIELRNRANKWGAEQKRDWVLNALRRQVRRSYDETPYYRNLFKSIGFDPNAEFGFEEFANIPVLDRETISSAGSDLISSNVASENRLKDATGGSTGIPTELWLGPEERGWKESGTEYLFAKIGVPLGSRTAYFWGHHLDVTATDSPYEKFRSFLTNERYFDCFRLSPEIFHRYHQDFERFKPDCIVAYASALGHFAEFLNEQKMRPRNYPRVCFVTGAEKLHAAHREAIEKVFGPTKPIHERYGGRDFGTAALQMDPNNSLEFEIDWAWAVVEPIIDDRNSSILVTKLHADAMPMLRYKVGDIGVFPDGSKPGHPVFTLAAVMGRELDRIWLPNGNWVAGAELPHLLKSFAVREFMFRQAEDYSVVLQIVPKEGFDDAEKQEILRVLSINLPNFKIGVNLVDQIERTRANKWRPVITQVKR